MTSGTCGWSPMERNRARTRRRSRWGPGGEARRDAPQAALPPRMPERRPEAGTVDSGGEETSPPDDLGASDLDRDGELDVGVQPDHHPVGAELLDGLVEVHLAPVELDARLLLHRV